MEKHKMFKNESDFKKLIDRLDIDTKPSPNHRENLRREMLSAFSKERRPRPVETPSAGAWRTITRTILKSRITKLAAAAVVVIGVLIGIHQISGPVDITSTAIAEMIDAMKQKPWMHIVMESNTGQFEVWVSFESQIGATKRSSGEVTYLDGQRHLSYRYNPGEQAITVSYVDADEITKGATSVWSFWETWLKKMTEEGVRLAEHKGLYEGKEAKIYKVKYSIDDKSQLTDRTFKTFQGQIIADMEQNLPVFAHQKLFDSKGNLIKEKKLYFNYPESGPGDIYALGVPATAKVLYEGAESEVQLAAELKRIEEMFAASDIDGLVAILAEAKFESSKVLTANYLAEIGDSRAIEPLEKLSAEWTGNRQENPFADAAATIQDRIASEDGQPAPDAEANRPAEETEEVLDFFVVHEETDAPLQGVELNIHIQRDGPDEKYKNATDKQGACRIKIGPRKTKYVSIEIRKENFVSMQARFRTTEGGGAGIPNEYTIALGPTVSIGGIVHNEQGLPIEAVTVKINRYSDGEYETEVWISIRDYAVKTDKNGKWSCNVMPKELGRFGIMLSHPEYVDDIHSRSWRRLNIEQLRAGTLQMLMKKGVVLAGYVSDQAGNPIKDASVLRGESRHADDKLKTKTDDQGKFEFGRVDYVTEILTVQAQGYAPELKTISIRQDMEPVEFILEPGYGIYGRVVDVNGNPINEAHVSVEEWRSYSTLEWRSNTDKDGRFVWDSAPPDEIKIYVRKNGYMDSRHSFLVASQDEYELVLGPQLKVSGTVVDANTGEPIEIFTATKGIQWQGGSRHWQTGSSSVKDFTDGKYQWEFSSSYPGHLIRIDAEGYMPAVSRVFDSNEGIVHFDFKLAKGKGPEGIVYLPDDKPAVDAEVYLVTKGKWVSFENATVSNKRDCLLVTTDDDGTFELTPQTEPYKLVVIHDEGFAQVTEEQFLESPEIYLEKWGRVEGDIFVGSKPGAGEKVRLYNPYSHNDPKGINFSFSYNATADDQGRFVIDRVTPGLMKIAISIVSEDGRRTSYSGMKDVEVVSGETSYATIGGDGRTVVGKIARPPYLDPDWPWNCARGRINVDVPDQTKLMAQIYKELELPRPAEFEQMTSTEIVQWFEQWAMSEEGLAWQKEFQDRLKEEIGDVQQQHYALQINSDGGFKADNVTEGDYLIALTFMGKGKRAGEPDYRNRLGVGKYKFTMPEITDDNIDQPLDLGLINLEMKMHPRLQIGQTAPAFTIDTLDGGKVSLADYRGKFLLLNFWMLQMQTQPAADEQMDKVRQLYQTYSDDERFDILGITMTASVDLYIEIANKYLAEKDITWKQGTLGFENQDLMQSYGVTSYPFNVLIDPNGTVLATGIAGEQLEQTVAEALQP